MLSWFEGMEWLVDTQKAVIPNAPMPSPYKTCKDVPFILLMSKLMRMVLIPPRKAT
jgi:hypothetical protein